MPRFECDECEQRKEYSIDELGARVRVDCPNEHGKMTYCGRKRLPWYRGHALSNLILIMLLFGVLATIANDVQDGTEATIILAVGLILAVFEIGRLSSGSEATSQRVSVGLLRLGVFYVSTIIMMAFTQNSVDTGEQAMLLILIGVTIGWHVLLRVYEWMSVGIVVRELVWEIVRAVVVVAVFAFCATEIKWVTANSVRHTDCCELAGVF